MKASVPKIGDEKWQWWSLTAGNFCKDSKSTISHIILYVVRNASWEIFSREYSQIFLLFLLDRRQNIPKRIFSNTYKRIFSNISFTFIGSEAKYSQENILKYFIYFYLIGGKIFPRDYFQIFILLLLNWRQNIPKKVFSNVSFTLLDWRQNIPKRIFSNISFTFIGLEAVWYFRHGVCIGCQQRGGSFGICNKQSILTRCWKYSRQIVKNILDRSWKIFSFSGGTKISQIISWKTHLHKSEQITHLISEFQNWMLFIVLSIVSHFPRMVYLSLKLCITLFSYLNFMRALSSKFVAKSGIKWGLYEIFPTPAVLLLHPSGNIFLSWTIAYWSTLFNVLLKSWIVKITLNEDEEGVFFVRQSSSGTSGNFVHPGSLQRRG